MKVHIKSVGFHKFLINIFIYHFLPMILCCSLTIEASEWKAGIASVIITPDEPVWMGGYGGRNRPSEGKIHDLYAKALALEDSEGNRAVILTADIIGFTREFSNNISLEIKKRYGIPREALFINTSHTHCGPATRLYRIPYFYNIPEEHETKIYNYIEWLKARLIWVISEAINDMKQAQLSFSSATPTPFTVNRRFPTSEGIVYRSSPSSYYTGGPRDDVVPFLEVSDPAGKIRAILFGYACHPITLNGYKFCGDYPGFAQRYVEEAFPGATALFIQGASGQLIPNARYQVEYAMGHGKSLADAVREAHEEEQIPVNGPLKCGYEEVILDFQPVPDRKVLRKKIQSENSNRRKIAYLLEKLDNNETIETKLPCPFQVIRMGQELLLIGLCGEPVVEYSLKFKSTFLTYDFVWVAGFCNDDFGYIPTWKILREGGYEGGDAMRSTPFPGPFDETVEKRVTEAVLRLVDNVSK